MYICNSHTSFVTLPMHVTVSSIEAFFFNSCSLFEMHFIANLFFVSFSMLSSVSFVLLNLLIHMCIMSIQRQYLLFMHVCKIHCYRISWSLNGKTQCSRSIQAQYKSIKLCRQLCGLRHMIAYIVSGYGYVLAGPCYLIIYTFYYLLFCLKYRK